MNPEMDRYRKAIARVFPDCQISGSGSSLIAAATDPRPEDLATLRSELPGARILRTRTVSRAEYETRSGMGSANFRRR